MTNDVKHLFMYLLAFGVAGRVVNWLDTFKSIVYHLSFSSVVLNWEQFSTPGDFWQCLETILVVTTGGFCNWHLVSRVRDAAKYHIIHRPDSTTKKLMGLNVNGARVENMVLMVSGWLYKSKILQGPNQYICRPLPSNHIIWAALPCANSASVFQNPEFLGSLEHPHLLFPPPDTFFYSCGPKSHFS